MYQINIAHAYTNLTEVAVRPCFIAETQSLSNGYLFLWNFFSFFSSCQNSVSLELDCVLYHVFVEYLLHACNILHVFITC